MTDKSEDKPVEGTGTHAAAVTASEADRPSTQEQVDASLATAAADREAALEPADIGAAGVTKMEASGAIIEDGAKKMVDVDHPAVDNNPRANTTARQNQIDFNDPTLTDREAIEQNLDNQS